MKAIQLTEYVKGPLDLTPTTLPRPTPKPDESLIRIHAAATNFFDLLQIAGKYQNQPPFPWIAGAEFAGIVEEIGAGSSSFKTGDKVFGYVQGAYAEYCCVKTSTLLPVPKGWSFADAAGLFITAPTSYAALTIRAEAKRGEWVLVHAGAGGVGLFAIQVAKAVGCTVIATASTAEKLAICKRFGADHVISYSDTDWVKEVLRLRPGGVDIVFDPVGLINQSLKCTAWNGRLLIIGFAAGAIEQVPMNRVLLKNVSLVGVHWGEYMKKGVEAGTVERVWRDILGMIGEGKIKPITNEKVYEGLENVGKALKALGARETWGKVVAKVCEDGDKKPTEVVAKL
ncbi:alcohol dehydrogenase [Saitoella complicata NRRL Y-17804]|uniref:alcohol dehydrogenase n=1 Tax=Saitoella complicata (strain BCRC 22490 / CBS 7301 / JCM 7358 / NBRC 10748 / NRRL Y-17804) TaxID=698492 RepID=UPI0008677814|nr:alcohol dehydrogenase [Saitoella complicata NRRL Y-17804]ODQ55174.1 alcohol dehydrogenase [Saitoella complicata NRRL Y-17804]